MCLSIVSSSFLIVQSQHSWAEFCNFDLYNPSSIKSEGISFTDNSAWLHLTSKSWTSSFCKLTVNNLRVLVPLHRLRLHGNAHGSCKQFVFHERIGRAALRHLLSCENECACREVDEPMQTQSSHQAYRSLENRFGPQSLAMSHVRQLTLPSQLLWSSAVKGKDLLSLNILQFWSRRSSLYFIESGIFPDAIPKSEISDNPSQHCEKISSTSMIIHSSISWEAWYRYCRIFRFSSHFLLRPLCISFSIRSQF